MQLTVANVIDIIMVVSFLVAIIRGWHIGLVMKLAHLLALVASCVIAHFVATLLKASIGTGVVLPILEGKAGDGLNAISFAKNGIAYVADGIAYYLIFGICFIIAMIVLSQLIHIFKIVDYIPVVGLLNKIGGAIISFMIEFIIFYIICAFVFNLTPQSTLDHWGLSKNAIAHTYILQGFVK